MSIHLLPPMVQRKILPSPACSTLTTFSLHLQHSQFKVCHISSSSSAPGTPPRHLLLLGAAQAEHVLARDHPPVDQDRLQTLVAAVDHRVDDLLAHQVHLVVPVQGQHWCITSVDGSEGWRLQLTDICLHVIFGNLMVTRNLHVLEKLSENIKCKYLFQIITISL